MWFWLPLQSGVFSCLYLGLFPSSVCINNPAVPDIRRPPVRFLFFSQCRHRICEPSTGSSILLAFPHQQREGQWARPEAGRLQPTGQIQPTTFFWQPPNWNQFLHFNMLFYFKCWRSTYIISSILQTPCKLWNIYYLALSENIHQPSGNSSDFSNNFH